MAKPSILIVDDEADILDLLEYNLEREGWEVSRAEDGEEAVEIARKIKPDLILMDIMMPKMDGVEACRRIRESPGGQGPFVVFLTARSEEYSEIAGFEAGGDDYIFKPIKPRLLISRIKAIFRRGRQGHIEDPGQDQKLKAGGLTIIPDEHLVELEGKTLDLPRKEFKLLEFFVSNPGKVFSREILLERIWGTDVNVVDRTVDVHVRKLREKIGKQYIKTLKGVGYKFIIPE